MITEHEHRGYRAHIEFEKFVWYRTTRGAVIGKSTKTGADIKHGTHMNRIVTNATTLEDAERQLDRALEKPKGEPKMDTSGNFKLEL